MEKETKYDSTIDAKEHRFNVFKVANPIMHDFETRIRNHDKSKLEDPEKSCYDEMIPRLKEAKYGSKEYYAIRLEMQQKGLNHHYQMNRHHPEHFKNKVADMNLVDALEMLIDWYAASMKSDTGFEKGFEQNCERFHITGLAKDLLWNTYLTYIRGRDDL